MARFAVRYCGTLRVCRQCMTRGSCWCDGDEQVGKRGCELVTVPTCLTTCCCTPPPRALRALNSLCRLKLGKSGHAHFFTHYKFPVRPAPHCCYPENWYSYLFRFILSTIITEMNVIISYHLQHCVHLRKSVAVPFSGGMARFAVRYCGTLRVCRQCMTRGSCWCDGDEQVGKRGCELVTVPTCLTTCCCTPPPRALRALNSLCRLKLGKSGHAGKKGLI